MKCFNLKLSAVNQHKVNWRFTADTCSWNNILCSFLFGVISTFYSSCLSCSQLLTVRPKTGFFETVLCLRSQADNNSSIKLCLCFKRDTIYGMDVGTVRFCKICSNFFFPYQSAICLSWHCCAFTPVGLRCEKPLSGKYLVYGLKFLYLSPQTAGNFPNMSCKKQTLVATKSATKSPNGRWHLLVEVVLNWVVLLGSRVVQVTYTHVVEMLMSYVWNLYSEDVFSRRP